MTDALALLANLALIALSVGGTITLIFVLVAVAKRLDPIVRNPWVCADCKARYATEAELFEHERLHLARRAAA